MISAPLSKRSGTPPTIAWIFSSIGKKTVIALTGMAMLLFLVGHLVGNFTLFLGPDAMNTYGVKLRELGPLLWIARIGLLAAVGLHIYFTMLIWKENQSSRPVKYLHQDPVGTTIFARTMRLTGLFVLAFVIFHLAHFTWGLIQPAYAHGTDSKGHHDIYSMVIQGFRVVPISLLYIAGLFFLTWHLSHGIGSLFQTLGLTNQKLRHQYETFARAAAWLLFVGYSSIPISVAFFGLGRGVVP